VLKVQPQFLALSVQMPSGSSSSHLKLDFGHMIETMAGKPINDCSVAVRRHQQDKRDGENC
jgi:hypothetical protein